MTVRSSIRALGGRSFWWWVGLSFLAHVAVIWLLGERPAPLSPGGDAFHTVLAENFGPLAARLPDYEDPQIFALPSPRGFSGDGWLRASTPPHEFHEWLEEQRWLPLPVEQLGHTFVEHVRLLTQPPLPTLRKAEPVLQTLMTDLSLDWAPVRSRLKLAEPLASRLIPPAPEPPVMVHKDLLRPSLVELLVDERGHVFAATLVGESGLASADETALNLARQLNFRPVPEPGLKVGRLTVEWYVQPSTNSVPAARAPAAP